MHLGSHGADIHLALIALGCLLIRRSRVGQLGPELEEAQFHWNVPVASGLVRFDSLRTHRRLPMRRDGGGLFAPSMGAWDVAIKVICLEEHAAPYYGGFSPEVTARLSSFGHDWHGEAVAQVVRLILAGVFDCDPSLRLISGHRA